MTLVRIINYYNKFRNVLYYKSLNEKNDIIKEECSRLLERFDSVFKDINARGVLISDVEYLDLLLCKIIKQREIQKDMIANNLQYTKEYYSLSEEIDSLQEKINQIKQ